MQGRRLPFGVGLLLALWMVLPSPGEAVTIYDNFAPGNDYNLSSGLGIGRPPGHTGDIYHAMPFTPTGPDFWLDRIELAVSMLRLASPMVNELDVLLMTDVGGLPGATIESFHFTDAMGYFGYWNTPLGADSVLRPFLGAGVQYWLAALPGSDYVPPGHVSFLAAWNKNSVGDTGPYARLDEDAGGTWVAASGTRGAFRIIGTPVPEPATLALFGLGCSLGLIARPRRRRT